MKPSPVIKVGPIQAYADGLLNDDELAELADMSIGNVILPVQQHTADGKNATQGHASTSLVPHGVSPPRINDAGLALARPNDGTIAVRSSSLAHQSAPSKESTPAISQEELEVSGYQSRRSN